MRITVIIGNYNYGRFVAGAIESVLNQTIPVELIVVDDGSTDESRSVLQMYAERATIIYQANGGQGAVYNTGYERSTGDVVCFLDADDKLCSDACERVAHCDWTGVSKVQGRLLLVGACDERHIAIPFGAVSPVTIDECARRFYFYNSPPGSGNFYARSYLSRVMPMQQKRWRICADAVLISAAPFFGKVVSMDVTLGQYRVHGGNATSELRGRTDRSAIVQYASKQLMRERSRRTEALRLFPQRFPSASSVSDTPSMIKFRLMTYVCRPRSSRLMRAYWMTLGRTGRCLMFWKHYGLGKRVLFGAWVAAMVVLPRRIAYKLVCATAFAYIRGY